VTLPFDLQKIFRNKNFRVVKMKNFGQSPIVEKIARVVWFYANFFQNDFAIAANASANWRECRKIQDLIFS